MERLNEKELKEIIDEMKKNGKYEEYQDMILDDYEEHQVVCELLTTYRGGSFVITHQSNSKEV